MRAIKTKPSKMILQRAKDEIDPLSDKTFFELSTVYQCELVIKQILNYLDDLYENKTR